MKKIFLILLVMIVSLNVAYAQNCSNLTTDIFIQIDAEPYIQKINSFLAVLPTQYKTHDVRCWSYITKDDNLQQTNPQMQEYSDTFFSLSKKIESREYFSAQNGVVNAYFTDKNLVSYTQFVLGVRCVSMDNADMFIGEKCITPVYGELKGVPARGVWVVQNMDILIVMFVVVVIILLFIGYIYRDYFKR